VAYAWHRLGQELDLRDERDHGTDHPMGA
jgi:hypothetical protein